MFLEILVEGGADRPAVCEILQRRFGLQEGLEFRIHPHKGKGSLPGNALARPNSKHRGLLDQLPAKLRGMSWMGMEYCVVVLVDADAEDCIDLKRRLVALYQSLNCKPVHVLFRIAVDETESCFIADPLAIKKAYPNADITPLKKIKPDAVIGAWERLAESLKKKPIQCRGPDKHQWAKKISPHLNLDRPVSPSLRAFIQGIDRCLSQKEA